MSRITKRVWPFYWLSAPTLTFTQGTTQTRDLRQYLHDPQKRVQSILVVSGTLPSGVTISGLSLAYNGSGAVASASVTLRATGVGYTIDSGTITVAIQGTAVNQPPVWTVPDGYALPSVTAAGGSIALADYAYDAEGDPMSFALVSSTAPGVSVDAETGVLTVPAGLTASSYTVQVSLSQLGFAFDSPYSGSGTFEDGETVTITGTGFGTKPGGGKPIAWFPFESSLDYDPAYSRSTLPIRTGSQYGELATDQLVPNSSASYRLDHKVHLNGGIGPSFVLDGDGAYIYCKRRWGFQPGMTADTTGNIEPYELSDSTAPAHAVSFTTVHPVPSIYGNPQYNVWPAISYTYLSRAADTGLLGLEWYTEELLLKESSAPDVVDGQLFHVRNGKRGVDTANRVKTRTATYPNPMTRAPIIFGMVFSVSGAGWPAQMYSWFDCMYLDDSWCRVMVSEESTWQDAKYDAVGVQTYRREIQLPLSWSDNAVQFTIRKGELASLSGQYLWLIKSDGSAVRIGQFT